MSKQRTPEVAARTTRIRLRILTVVAVVFGAVIVYAVWFNPASKPGAADAYRACTSAIAADLPNMIPDGPGDVSYSGTETEMTVTGSYRVAGQSIRFVCQATLLSSGVYTATYELP